MTVNEAKELLGRWYSINAGTAFRWKGENAEIWGAVVFADAKILADKIEKALAQLPAQWRNILRLLYFEKVTEREVARVLSVSPMRLKNLHYLALTRFIELWKD